MCLSSSSSCPFASCLFLSHCSFPFLFFCCLYLFPVPLPSPFCCYVPFLAIVRFFLFLILVPFFLFASTISSCSLIFFLVLPFLFFYSVGLQFAACKGWGHMLFANLCVHTHTHRRTVRMPVLIPKIATRKRGEETMTRK